MITLKERATEVFYGAARDKYPDVNSSESRLSHWYHLALKEFKHMVRAVPEDADGAEEIVLGLIMYRWFLQQRFSRVSQLNSISTREIRLAATGETKKSVKADLDSVTAEVEKWFHRFINHAHGG